MPQYNSFTTKPRAIIQPKPLGLVLQEANLLAVPQIQLALRDQISYPYLRLGEILAMRGWIKQETADFFAQDWLRLTQQKHRQRLGYYLRKSALINQTQIEAILEEQKYTGLRFGSVAVVQGLLKTQTLEFFLMNLFPHELAEVTLTNKYQINARVHVRKSSPAAKKFPIIEKSHYRDDAQLLRNQILQNQSPIPEIEELEETEIKWIG